MDTFNQEIQSAVYKAIDQRLGGIEDELRGVRELLTRMVVVEERQRDYRAENNQIKNALDNLYDRMRKLETETAVNAARNAGEDRVTGTRIATTERVLWLGLTAAIGALVDWFHK